MKKAICIITTLLCAGAVLGGCSSKNKETYIDIDSNYQVLDSELAEKLQQTDEPLNTVITNYKQDTKRKYKITPIPNITFDDRYMYLYTFLGTASNSIFEGDTRQKYKIDLQSGALVSLCDIPACTHDSDKYPECINNKRQFYTTMVGDELWEIDANKIISVKDGKIKTVYENSSVSELQKSYQADTAVNISQFIVDGQYIYIIQQDQVCRVDRRTMKAEEPLVVTDGIEISNFYLDTSSGSLLYANSAANENYLVDFEANAVEKIGEGMTQTVAYDNNLYYIRYEGDKCALYTCPQDMKGEETLLKDDIGKSKAFIVKDGKLFYANENELHMLDLSSDEDIMLSDYATKLDIIVSADHIDRVFTIGTKDNNDIVLSVRTDGSDLWKRMIDGSDLTE